jgi:hypothetical protein
LSGLQAARGDRFDRGRNFGELARISRLELANVKSDAPIDLPRLPKLRSVSS